MKFAVLLAASLLAFTVPAHARHHHRHHHHHHHKITHHGAALGHGGGTVVGGRPAGCPHAFCGCGASLYLFHRIIPELNLAWAWARRFPRISMAEASNGDAAVRHHHVAVVLANLGGGNFKLYDANSGGHATRIHVRHLAGYIFVRPRS